MTTTFNLDPQQAILALEAMLRAPDGPVAIAGDAWAHGAMATLVRAELLAAQAGVVPWFTDPETGQRGVLSVGAAREHMDKAPEDVRAMYLGTHALIRQTHAMAAPWDGRAPLLGELEELGEPVSGVAIVIALVVVAIAGIVATAWYFGHRATIEVDGRNLRTTSIASTLLETARDQLDKTGKIDPKLWEVFKGLADNERPDPNWIPFAVGGAVLLAGIGAVGYAWMKARQHAANMREVDGYLRYLDTPEAQARLAESS